MTLYFCTCTAPYQARMNNIDFILTTLCVALSDFKFFNYRDF